MRFNRIVTATITAGVVGLVPVAVSSPASAAATYATTVALEAGAPAVVYGDEVSFSGAVSDTTTGAAANTGTVSLQVYSGKNPVWTEVQTDTTPSSFSFYDVKPASNSQYRVVYSGATETDGDVYTPSESAPVNVGVQRKTILKTKGLVVIGKVKPDFGKKKIVIKKKQGKKFVPFKKIKTDAKGAFRFKAPSNKGFTFSVTIPSDSNYIGYTEAYEVI